MKKALTFMLAALLLLSFVACGGTGGSAETAAPGTPDTAATPAQTETQASTPTATIDPNSEYTYAGGNSQSGLGRTITDYSKYYDVSLEVIAAGEAKLAELAEKAGEPAPVGYFIMEHYAMSATINGSEAAQAIADEMGLTLTVKGNEYLFEGDGETYSCVFNATATALSFTYTQDGVVKEFFELTYQGGNNYTLQTLHAKMFVNYKSGTVKRIYIGVLKDEGSEARTIDPALNSIMGTSGIKKTWVTDTEKSSYKQLWQFENEVLTVDISDFGGGAYTARDQITVDIPA